MEAFTEASTKSSVEVISVKASSTYAKTSTTSMKAPVKSPVEVSLLQPFISFILSMKASTEVSRMLSCKLIP